MIKQVVNPRERVLSLNGDFIKLAVSIHILKDPSLFLTKKIGAPNGEILGLMKIFSSKSLSCALNSFNSAGDIQYIGTEMGFVSGSTSMPKSISHQEEYREGH